MNANRDAETKNKVNETTTNAFVHRMKMAKHVTKQF